MPTTRHSVCLLLTFALCAAGCDPTPIDEDPPLKATEAAAAAPKTKESNSADLDIVEKSWAEVQEKIQTLDGKVVVVNIWTNTCAVCLAEFPSWAALTRKYTGGNVVFYDINCDYDGIEDKPLSFYRPQVVEFLKDKNAQSRHVALTDALIDFLDESNIRSTPTVLVYDAQGELVKQFDNDEAYKEEDEFHMDDVGTLIDGLLDKS